MPSPLPSAPLTPGRTILVSLDLDQLPATISDSIRACLGAHGLALSDERLREIGRNVSAVIALAEVES